HNLDVIKTSDWIIDMGPAGGHRGGTVVAVGTPEELAEVPASYTGQFLRPVLGLTGEAAGGPDATAPAEVANNGQAPGKAAATPRKSTSATGSKSAVKRAAATRR